MTFAVDNREVAHVSLFPLPYMADLPLFLFAILVFFIGAVVGYGCSNAKARRLNLQLKAEIKRGIGLQNQLDAQAAERVRIAPPAPLSAASSSL